MKRREFLKSSLAATSLAGLASVLKTSAAEQSAKAQREFYELRLYHLRRGPKQKLFDDFYREAAIPAMNRAGIGPVGVLNVAYGPDSPTMHVLNDVQQRRDCHIPSDGIAASFLRRNAYRREDAEPDLHACLREHGRAGEKLGRVRLRSGMEKVEQHTRLHRRRNRHQHQQPLPAPNRLFADLAAHPCHG